MVTRGSNGVAGSHASDADINGNTITSARSEKPVFFQTCGPYKSNEDINIRRAVLVRDWLAGALVN